MEEELKKLSDCYFYFYSSCTKGDACPYRHCEQALGTERVCSLWKEGRCLRSNCKFRHMESRIDRRSIPCYWENKPGGCRKPHCVFFHFKPKACNENQELILPVSSLTPSTTPIIKCENIDAWKPSEAPPVKTEKEDIQSSLEPFVVSIDENEESDAESITSTPVKLNDAKSGNIKGSNLLSKFSAKSSERSLDFEIKSLEQIRLEKIHKESANIYMTDYEVPTLEDYKKKRVLDEDQSYPPSSDFIMLQSESPLDDVEMKEVAQVPIKKTGDLRVFLSQSKESSISRVNESPNKIVSIKKEISPLNDPLGFKIKTLDEIRKEKMVKKEVPSAENENRNIHNQLNISSIKKESSETYRKLKINRKSLNSSGQVNEGLEKYLRDRVNIKTEPTDIYCTNLKSPLKVKRKSSISDEDKNNKMLKREPPELEDNNHVLNSEQKSPERSPLHIPIVSVKNPASNPFSVNPFEATGDLKMESECPKQEASIVQSTTMVANQIEQCQNGKRSISMDDIDNFLSEDAGEEDTIAADDDILLEINKFLES